MPLGVTPYLGRHQVLGHLCQQPVHHSAWQAAVIFTQDALQLTVHLRSDTLGTGTNHDGFALVPGELPTATHHYVDALPGLAPNGPWHWARARIDGCMSPAHLLVLQALQQ